MNTLPISDHFDLNSMKRVLDGAYVKDKKETSMKMKMCSIEQKNGMSLEEFIDNIMKLIGWGYLDNCADRVC